MRFGVCLTMGDPQKMAMIIRGNDDEHHPRMDWRMIAYLKRQHLVGGFNMFQPTPLKNDGLKVSWDDYIFTIWMESHNPVMFQSPPTSWKFNSQLILWWSILFILFPESVTCHISPKSAHGTLQSHSIKKDSSPAKIGVTSKSPAMETFQLSHWQEWILCFIITKRLPSATPAKWCHACPGFIRVNSTRLVSLGRDKTPLGHEAQEQRAQKPKLWENPGVIFQEILVLSDVAAEFSDVAAEFSDVAAEFSDVAARLKRQGRALLQPATSSSAQVRGLLPISRIQTE